MPAKAKTTRTPKKVHVPAFDMLGVGGLLGSTQRVQPDPLRQLEAEEVAEQRKMVNNLRHEELILRRENRIDREMQKQDALRGKNKNDSLDGLKKVLEIKNILDVKKEDSITEQVGKALVPAIINSLTQRQPDPLDQIMRYQQAGFIPAHNTTGEHNAFSVEAQKMRNEHEFRIRELDLKDKERELRYMQRNDIITTITKALAPVVASVSEDALKKAGENMARQAKHGDPGTIRTVLDQTPNVEPSKILIKCNCGFTDDMYFHGAPPNLINCPECNQELRTGTLDELNVSDIRRELGEGDQNFVA